MIKIKITENCGCANSDEDKEMPPEHHGDEGSRMHRTTLAHLSADVQVLLQMIQDGDDLPEWLEAKITKAGDYMSAAARYITGNIAREHGQLEEQEQQIDVPMKKEQVLQTLAQLTDEELAEIMRSDVFQRAMERQPQKGALQEGFTGLADEILIESHFKMYNYLQDAIDENGKTPCPQCLYEILSEATCGCPDLIPEAKYRGRTVTLNKPSRGDVKKFKVYVKNAKGNVVKVNFGHGGTSAKKKGEKTMKIRKSNKKARKSFRARHNCKSPGPKWKARYWSCRKW
jgi:hypothetical protein